MSRSRVQRWALLTLLAAAIVLGGGGLLLRVAAVPSGTPLLQVHLSTPVEVCADRDVKGLYLKALAGEIPHFTGVSDPYEAPTTPDLHLRTDRISVQEGVQELLRSLGEA